MGYWIEYDNGSRTRVFQGASESYVEYRIDPNGKKTGWEEAVKKRPTLGFTKEEMKRIQDLQR